MGEQTGLVNLRRYKVLRRNKDGVLESALINTKRGRMIYFEDKPTKASVWPSSDNLKYFACLDELPKMCAHFGGRNIASLELWEVELLNVRNTSWDQKYGWREGIYYADAIQLVKRVRIPDLFLYQSPRGKTCIRFGYSNSRIEKPIPEGDSWIALPY